jgi:DNA polymerase-3 subunit gamma/tau
MRDALSLTDQAIAYAAGAVTLDAVQGMLGALDQSYLVRLLDALARQDGADLMAVADEMASRSLSYNGALQDLGTLLHRIALAQTVPTAVPEDLPELADIQRLATVFDPQEVQLYYQIVVHGRNEIGLAPDEYAGFTMTLLRMLAFRPGQGGAEQAAAPAPAALARPLPQAQAARPAAAASAAAAAPARAAAPNHGAAPAAAAPSAAPQAQAQATPAAPQASGGAAALSPARAAINAALEAARAASRMGGGGRRPPGPSEAPAAAAAQPAAVTPAPAASAPGPAPMASAAPAPAARPSAPAPWDQPAARPQPQAVAQQQPAMARGAEQGQAYDQAVADDEPPSWVTEFSDDSAVSAEAPATLSPPPPAARAAAPGKPSHAYVVTPVPAIGWDGNWPALAASLPLRGVAQQLAFQTELVDCTADGATANFRLRVPVDTLRASGNSEKLCAALQERFPAVRVNIDTEIGPVWYTASAEARARREQLQREAEASVGSDPFIQALEQTFDAFVVPGSVRPIGT